MKHIGQHAVVIGASMGGLLAARALSDFYAVVTVLERDNFPLSDIPRKGVPQGRHAHGLLARGRAVIERFFPGWTDEVVASGGVRGDIAGDVHWIGHGVTIKSAPSDLIGLLAYFEATGDKSALDASRKIGDLLVATFGTGAGQRDIIAA